VGFLVPPLKKANDRIRLLTSQAALTLAPS